MLESKPKENPVSSNAVDLFLRSGGVGVREMSTSNTEGIRRLLDKCREQRGGILQSAFFEATAICFRRWVGNRETNVEISWGLENKHLSSADWLKTPKLTVLGKNIDLVAIACDLTEHLDSVTIGIFLRMESF